MTHHLDESGQPCTRHVPASPERILALAVVGSSTPSFHHDIASKLQSLIMSLDEIAELTENSDVRMLVTTAEDTIRELSELLATNRSLVRPSRRGRHAIAKLIALAAERTGVRVPATIPAFDVEVGLFATTHGLSLIFDLAAGPVPLGRTLDVKVTAEPTDLVLEVAGPAAALQPLPSNFDEVMTLAAFALAREAGQLRCGPGRFTIRLPRAT